MQTGSVRRRRATRSDTTDSARASRPAAPTAARPSAARVGVTSSVLDDGTKKFTPGVSSREGSTSTFQHSGLKNATEQSNSSQTETASRQYDAFGNVQSSSGTWQGPFGYAGSFGYQEDPNGLKLLGHRYYDSSTGRFITSDPAGHGSNWYAYGSNNPVSSADPNGLEPMPLFVIVVGSITGLNDDGAVDRLIRLLTDYYTRQGYRVAVVYAKHPSDFIDALEDADAAAYIGHGTPLTTGRGRAILPFEWERLAQRRKKRGKGKMSKLLLYSCSTMADQADRNNYFLVADSVYGYDGSCWFGPTSPSLFGGGKWWGGRKGPNLGSPAIGGPRRFPAI